MRKLEWHINSANIALTQLVITDCSGACPGGGGQGPGPPPLEIEKQKKKKKKKKKGFQILGPPSYEFLDTRLLLALMV